MAGGSTGVTAVFSWIFTHLSAGFPILQTQSFMADTFTRVLSAWKKFATRHSTRDICNMARNVTALLMVTITPLYCQLCARWTFIFTVAWMPCWMPTCMRSRTFVRALWRFCSTWYWRVHYTCTTVACKLLKTRVPASRTVATVTQLLTIMQPTWQLPVAHLFVAKKNVKNEKFGRNYLAFWD